MGEAPAPERLCARIVFGHIWQWYTDLPDRVLDVLDMYFDRGEPYLAHIQEDWRTKRIRRQYPAWDLIRTIAPADMRTTIPLQVADMFAWARNRLKTGQKRDVAYRFAEAVDRVSLSGLHRDVGEKAMADSVFEESLLRREQMFKSARKRHV